LGPLVAVVDKGGRAEEVAEMIMGLGASGSGVEGESFLLFGLTVSGGAAVRGFTASPRDVAWSERGLRVE
jgi:hypothetical protein